MKRQISILLIWIFIVPHAFSWGKTGHRVVGLIAEKHLTRKAKKRVQQVLGTESLADVSNYMDFIRSNPKYDHMVTWHYTTIPDSLNYEQAGTPEKGDVIVTINRLVAELTSKHFTDEDEAFALKLLVHLVGDIHQPLHVGNGKDKGGNAFKIEYFWRGSNLHRVWDSEIIDGQEYSYTEYTTWIDKAQDEEIKSWQAASVLDWAYESKALREQVYNIPESNKINYRYDYENVQTVNQRLLQAGIRLAGILNRIYG